eukprot:1522135-Lingulodinium_polyedra.AAC.1
MASSAASDCGSTITPVKRRRVTKPKAQQVLCDLADSLANQQYEKDILEIAQHLRENTAKILKVKAFIFSPLSSAATEASFAPGVAVLGDIPYKHAKTIIAKVMN